MFYTLPPDTSNLPVAGTLTISIKLIYIDIPISTINYGLRFWGYSKPIIIDPQSLTKTFNVTTNIAKLTQYFNDMGVLSLQVLDQRLNKVLGVGFVKLRRYIVNDTLSQFEEEVDIIGAANTINRQKKIGSVSMALLRNVPQALQTYPQQLQENIAKKDFIKEEFPQKQNKRRESSMPLIRQESEKNRILLMDRHIFDVEEEKQQFHINQKGKRDSEVIRQQELQKSKKQINREIQRKNISLQQLHDKYGKNNPCIERMKLRMDEAKLFPKNSYHYDQNNEQLAYQLHVTDFKVLVNKCTQKQLMITLAQKNNKPILMKNISIPEHHKQCMYLNNITMEHKLLLETNEHVGQCSTKALLNAGLARVYMKRKDNNKRQLEVFLKIQKRQNEREEIKYAENNIKHQNNNNPSSMHYLIMIKPMSDADKLGYVIQVDGHQPFSGDKIIYQHHNTKHKAKVQVISAQNRGSTQVTIDASYKEEVKNIRVGKQEYVQVHILIVKTKQFNEALSFIKNSNPSNTNQYRNHQEHHSNNHNPNINNNNSNNKLSRQQLFKIAIQSYQSLCVCEDGQCFELIDRLINKYDHNTFKMLSRKVNMPQQTYQAFTNIFHQQFEMYWKCFEEYRSWNSQYRKAITHNHNYLRHRNCLPSQSILKLKRNSKSLFGMLGVSVVETELNKYIQQQEQCSLQQMLVLLTRYNENMVKIDELYEVFGRRQTGICLRYTQLQEIYNSQEQTQHQLLKEVCLSCMSTNSNISVNGSARLLQILHKYQHAPTQQSIQQTQRHMHTITEGNMNTQGNILHTQPNHILHTQQEHKSQQQQQQQQQRQDHRKQEIVLCISHIQIQSQLYDNKLTSLRIYRQQEQSQEQVNVNLGKLPFAFTLQMGKQYKVQGMCGEQRIQGIFIANREIRRVVLYVRAQRIGNIVLTYHHRDPYSLDQSIVRLQVHNKTQLLSRDNQIYINNNNKNSNEGDHKQQQIINAEYGKSCNNYEHLQIKIHSIKPYKQQHILKIQGNNQLIKFPQQNTCILNNHNKHQPYLQVYVDGVGHDHIIKELGTQEVCITQNNNKVNTTLTIQVQQYTGQRTLQIGNKVMYLNLYYLHSFAPMETGSYSIVIHTHSQSQPIVQKSLKVDGQSRHTNIMETVDICAGDNEYDIDIFQGNEVIAHFMFKIRYNSQLGVFMHKGYLTDRGYRLGLSLYQINYNDIFCKDEIGISKFQSLLIIFKIQYLMKLNPKGSNTQQTDTDLKKVVRRSLGYTNTQIDALFSLQSQICNFNQLMNWQLNTVHQHIQTGAYTLYDLFTQYQLFDFESNGYIPQAKAQIVNKLVLNRTPIQFSKVHTNNKQGWLIDINNKEGKGYVDYMFILWNLKTYAQIDDFYHIHTNNDQHNPHYHNHHESTLDRLQNTSFYGHKRRGQLVQIYLLGYKSLKVNGSPGTLLFKVNDQQFTDPIPRCYSHEYVDPPSIRVRLPLKLQILNKSYGIKALWQYKLVQTLYIQNENVRALQGQIMFRMAQCGQQSVQRQNRNGWTNEMSKSKNRRQKWNEERESDASKRISNILHTRLDYSELNLDD